MKIWFILVCILTSLNAENCSSGFFGDRFKMVKYEAFFKAFKPNKAYSLDKRVYIIERNLCSVSKY